MSVEPQPLPAQPDFEEFFAALEKRSPFPWQRRLARQVAAEGAWPTEIGVPTGLGKTVCLDIAVWSLAAQAHGPSAGRTAPTRVWYVVNRRLLVDAAAERAERLAEALREGADRDADADPVAAVAHRLRSLIAYPSAAIGPLHVVRLRGGAPLGERAHDPTQPALLLATVPMFASRWLFRGYGSSPGMRSIDAAQAGTDSLVLLDEAHLAPHLRRVADHAAQCDVGDPAQVLEARSRPRLVGLTATGNNPADRFQLDDEDLADPTVRTRLDATKLTTVRRVPTAKATAKAMAEEVVAALDRPAVHRILVFANTVAGARDAHARIQKATARRERPCRVTLLTGRTRGHEAASVRDDVLDSEAGMRTDPSRADKPAPPQALVVVATQTLEVGADLDADALITESCGVRALTQRLGRLNRLGQRDDAQAVIVHADDLDARARAGGDKARTAWPVYGLEPATVVDRLGQADSDDPVDLSPGAIAAVLGEPADTPARVGELLPAHLWEWAKTSCPPPDEAPAELFYDRIEEPNRTVTVCWRAYVPPDDAKVVPGVMADETVDVPIGDARELLERLSGAKKGDAESFEVRALNLNGGTAATILLRDLRPGHVLLLPPDWGGHDEHGFDASSTLPVPDRSALDSGVLTLDAAALKHLAPDLDMREAAPLLDELAPPAGEAPDPTSARHAAEQIVKLLERVTPATHVPDGEWIELLEGLRVGRQGLRLVLAEDGGAPRLLPQRQPRPPVRLDELDEHSFDVGDIALDKHLQDVALAAGRIADRLGLAEDLVQALQAAAALHDIGKADPRFQRWLAPEGVEGRLVAKSASPLHRRERLRAAAGWPRGGRHEAISLRLAAARLRLEPRPCWSEHADLVLHLIASHHGHGRPSLPQVRDRTAVGLVSTVAEGQVVEAADDLALGDWDQPARFRHLCEIYGYWGLALLETVVRQADHIASRAVEAPREARS